MTDPDRAFLARRLIPLDRPPPEAEPTREDEIYDDFAVGAAAPAAVLIGLVPRPQGLMVLLTRRADSLRRHTGQIALPGGRCDPGEGALPTALREAWEEIGLDRRWIDPLGFSDPFHTRTGFWVTPVVAMVSSEAAFTANPAEVAEIFETPFHFLMDPVNHQHRSAILGGTMRRFYAMEHDGRTIWGITAGMLQALYLRLYGEAIVG